MNNTVNKILVASAAFLLFASLASATTLQNIEEIQPVTGLDINITGNLDMQGNLVDGVDLDGTGNAIIIDGSNNYAVASNSIAVTELNTGSTDSRYVNRGGDAMSGYLNMNGYEIRNFFSGTCGDNQHITGISDAGAIQCGSDSGDISDITAGNALTGGGSSGAISVAVSSNSIALDELNTGSVDGRYVNLGGDTMSGSLSLGGFALTNVDWSTSDNPNTDSQSLSISGHTISLTNGGSVTVPDNVEDTQTLSETLTDGNDAGGSVITNLGSPGASSDAATKGYVDGQDHSDDQALSISGHTVSLTNGGSVTVPDNYEANTDSQSLSTTADVSGTNDQITISNGNSITIDDDYAANTDTQDLSISGHTISLTNGGSVTVPDNYEANTDSQGLSNVLSYDSTVNSGEVIDATSGAFRVPVGTDAW